LKYKETPAILLAATHGRGCFTFDVGTIVGINSHYGIPDKYSLSQNYPNPFNPSTVISYELAVSGLVSLKVYDVLGNEVKTLIDKKQNSGKYEVTFNGNNIHSGVYFYKLITGDFIETRSMILLK